MNGRERFEAVIRGEVPDRVPVMCQLSTGYIIKNSAIPPAEFLLNYNDVCVDACINAYRKLNFDGALIEAPGIDTEFLKSQVDKIVDKTNGQLIIWKNGDETFCPTNDDPIHKRKIKPIKKSITEIKAADLLYGLGYRMKLKDLPDYYMKPNREIMKKIGDTHLIIGWFVTPLSLFIHTFGVEDALISLIDYPEVCLELLEEISEGCMLWADNQIDIGLPVIGASSPFEGSGLISLEMYEEFGFPFTKKIIQHIKKRGIPTYMHMCGAISDRLERIAETGIDGIECLDPYPLGNVDLEDAVNRIGSKVFIKGNMDSVNTLLTKTPDEVYQDAVNRIKIAGPTKRYILSSACSVSPNTPEENLNMLERAAEDYGRY